MAKKKPSKPLLTWSKRPTREHDREMGWRRRWLGRGLFKYAVTQYVELSGQFICTVWTLGGWSLMGTKATLLAAQRLCEADAKSKKE